MSQPYSSPTAFSDFTVWCVSSSVSRSLQLQRLECAFDTVKKQLLDQLHSVLREQLLGTAASPEQEGQSRRGPLLLSDSSQGPTTNGMPASQAVILVSAAEEQQ